ncbi:MAG: hypothetical protein H7Y31_04470 [Chitinophagaceae bacterium]|nr:hypothetical protein [Chitinophagaceae bacterium]
MLKKRLSPSELLLIAVNLIPVWGVWFEGWDPREVFFVYCLETVIIGLFTLVRFAIAGSVKKTDVWNKTETTVTKMPTLFFMVFFLIHYGFFVAVQLTIFLEVSGAERSFGISNPWQFVTNFTTYLSKPNQWLLLAFVISYGFVMIKDFLWTGAYKTTPLNVIMFEPYGRIFVQQFTVIVGSMFLGFGAGKAFITIFVLFKLLVDVLIDYRRIISIAARKQALAESRKQ